MNTDFHTRLRLQMYIDLVVIAAIEKGILNLNNIN